MQCSSLAMENVVKSCIGKRCQGFKSYDPSKFQHLYVLWVKRVSLPFPGDVGTLTVKENNYCSDCFFPAQYDDKTMVLRLKRHNLVNYKDP